MTSLLASLQQAQAQNATDGDLLEGAKTALALRKTVSQHCISSYVKVRRELAAEKAVIDAEFRQYRTSKHTELGRLQACLDDETKLDVMILKRSRTYSINWMVL